MRGTLILAYVVTLIVALAFMLAAAWLWVQLIHHPELAYALAAGGWLVTVVGVVAARIVPAARMRRMPWWVLSRLL